MIREDKSYLSSGDVLAIEKGYAMLDIHSLRISGERLTDEQMKENGRLASIMTKEEWSNHCSILPGETALKIKPLIEALNKKYIIYQYANDNMDYKSNWDLFFWCNGGDDEDGRDLSYIKLSTNDIRTLEERAAGINDVLEYIKEIGFTGIDIAIQYDVKYNKEMIKEAAENYFEKVKNIFINCMGHSGRIKEGGTNYKGEKVYRFFKKGARSKYHPLSGREMFMMSLR